MVLELNSKFCEPLWVYLVSVANFLLLSKSLLYSSISVPCQSLTPSSEQIALPSLRRFTSTCKESTHHVTHSEWKRVLDHHHYISSPLVSEPLGGARRVHIGTVRGPLVAQSKISYLVYFLEGNRALYCWPKVWRNTN